MFEKTIVPARCRKYEHRLEEYLGGAPDSELSEHLLQCADCRATLGDAHAAGDLLRGTLRPAAAPGRAFTANVMFRIREQESRARSLAAFWMPFELLASRLAMTAAVLLLAISVYLAKFAPAHRAVAPAPTRAEVSAADLPQPPGDPVSNDEILVSLSERNYGR